MYIYIFIYSPFLATHQTINGSTYVHPKFHILLSLLAGFFEASAVSIQLLLEGFCGLLLVPWWMFLGFGSSGFLQDHLILRNAEILKRPWDKSQIPVVCWHYVKIMWFLVVDDLAAIGTNLYLNCRTNSTKKRKQNPPWHLPASKMLVSCAPPLANLSVLGSIPP